MRMISTYMVNEFLMYFTCFGNKKIVKLTWVNHFILSEDFYLGKSATAARRS